MSENTVSDSGMARDLKLRMPDLPSHDRLSDVLCKS